MKSEGILHQDEVGQSVSVEKNMLQPVIVAAHELKSPLALMRQLALELKAGTNTPEQQRIAEQLQLVAERSLRFTSNLTKYKQLQTTLFATQPVNITEVLRDITAEISPLYEAHGRKLAYGNTTRNHLVVANYDLLRRIMLNFVDNALHYSNSDGVVELYAKLVRDKDCIRLGVRDRGPALPTSVWQSIYSEALTAQPVHARPTSSGLGLRIASEFAHAMNAEVGATRHRDGASFYVDLPISKQLSLL